MSVAIKKLDGVEKVDVSLEKASAVITLKPENTVTLPILRRAIRSNGYPTRDAQIEARGTIVERDGKLVLDLLNGSVLELAGTPPQRSDKPVEITGVSREDDKRAERLTIASVKAPGAVK